MTTTTDTSTAHSIDALAAETERRSAYTAGLRALADLLDAHLEVPVPHNGSTSAPLLIMALSGDQRQALRDIARALPGTVRKNVRGEYFDLLGNLAGLHVQVISERDKVCERIVTGTHEITREVADPEALAAVPTTTVTETVEDVEWVCTPLLASEQVPA